MANSTAITKSLLLALSDTYGRRACVQRINTMAALLPGRDGKMRTVRSAVPGSPDVLGVVCGRGYAGEVKAGADRQRPEQRLFQAAWEMAGGIYLIVRDVGQAMAELAELLGR